MNKLYEETDIQNIANAIREKAGTTDTFKVSEMADAISEIKADDVNSKVLDIIRTGNFVDIINIISSFVEAVDISRQIFNTNINVE